MCVARLDGRVVLLRLALPGERVLARVTQRRSKFWRAQVVQVLDASPDRVPHPWPAGQAAGVGGMDMAHVAPAAARAAKAQVVGEQLSHALRQVVEVVVNPVGDAGPLGWRTRLDLVAGQDGRLGMYGPRSDRPVLVDAAPMAVPAIRELGLFERRFAPGRVVAVAPSDGPAFVVGQDQAAPRRNELVRLADEREWRYSLDGRGFWQAHYMAPATLVSAVLERLGQVSGAVVWDLYCGAGLFTLPLAGAVGADGLVVGVEAGHQAQRDALANLDGLASARLVRADVAQFVARAAAGLAGALAGGAVGAGSLPGGAAGAGALAGTTVSAGVPPRIAATARRPDVVVLDPPRAGLGPAVVQALTSLAPPLILYVSCEVSTLARDLAGLVAGGYQVTGVTGFDLFPGTWHVETITVLVRPGAG